MNLTLRALIIQYGYTKVVKTLADAIGEIKQTGKYSIDSKYITGLYDLINEFKKEYHGSYYID